MNAYKISFNGIIYSEDFEFLNENPSIEIKRNDETRTIYEKPDFDFRATGQFFDDIEAYQIANEFCSLINVEIIRNGSVIWYGYAKANEIRTKLSSSQGNVKEVVVIDRNYNAWFMSFQSIAIDLFNVFDLDCNITDIPAQVPITLFEPDTPANTHDRFLYRIGDAFSHIVKVMTRGNVVFVSDYFTSGDGADVMMGTGDMIARESALYVPVLSYSDMRKNFDVFYNMWARHYEENGINYVRIEPYDYFFDDSERLALLNVAEMEQTTKLEKIYATATVGDDNPVDSSFTGEFVDFEFDSFRKQVVSVGNECAWDSELNLVGSFLVDSDKIHYALEEGDTDTVYEKNIFVIETDGSAAIEYDRTGFSYYNHGLLNSSILKRHFDGISPITVFPEDYGDYDYFKGILNERDSAVGNGAIVIGVSGGAGENIRCANLRLYCDTYLYDINSALSTQAYNATAAGDVSGSDTLARSYTQWQCQTASNYAFRAKIMFAIDFIVSAHDPQEVRVEIIHTDSAGTFIAQYNSEYVSFDDYQVQTIDFETEEFACAATDKVYVRVTSKWAYALAGNVAYKIWSGSTFDVLGCQNFKSEFQAETMKLMPYITKIDEFILTDDQFDSFRANPTMSVRATSNGYIVNGYAESLKFYFNNRNVSVDIVGTEKIYQP